MKEFWNLFMNDAEWFTGVVFVVIMALTATLIVIGILRANK